MANEKGTTVYELQRKFQSVFGFTLPLFHGRGLLNCEFYTLLVFGDCRKCTIKDNLGLMPYRRRIVAVSKYSYRDAVAASTNVYLVGRPIHVEKCEKPSIEEVKRVQETYITELMRWVLITYEGQPIR